MSRTVEGTTAHRHRVRGTPAESAASGPDAQQVIARVRRSIKV
ncbi:hypothetical protein [Streptomyces sp. CB02400]|nr:hypothetical protein [Streptomyces sp. CB02400]